MIAAAAGDERVIAHPAHHAGITTTLLLFGGPALYIGAQTWHGRTLFDDLPTARLIALSALIVGCAVTPAAPAYLAAVVAAAIVVTLAAFEDRTLYFRDPCVDGLSWVSSCLKSMPSVPAGAHVSYSCWVSGWVVDGRGTRGADSRRAASTDLSAALRRRYDYLVVSVPDYRSSSNAMR
ncbi:hypothetical protein [Streptomyces coeruleofuscus]|uniref:Integral membrane protein n=1 Tax=Streptomyces coeruleofuscus TaxID=66879 RepID=A0ABP5W2W6_9ACTN